VKTHDGELSVRAQRGWAGTRSHSPAHCLT
jgi:hypothetical protein